MRIAVVVVVVLAAGAARAQDFVGTRAMSLSEAYRATATGNDAIDFNPAGLGVIPRYAVELNYQLDVDKNEHTADISVVDSKTSAVAAGLSYTFDAQFAQRRALQHKATLALAYAPLAKLLSVGAGLKYVNVSDAFAGNYLNALSADLGFLSHLPFGVSVAGVGYNLIPIQSQRAPISAGFGLNLDMGPISALIFGGAPSLGAMPNAAGLPTTATLGDPQGPLAGLTLEGDWNIDFATLYGIKHRLSAGGEYLAFGMIPLRGGYLWDQATNDQQVSVGAGFIVPYFGLDVGFRQSVLHANTRVFAIGLKFFLPM
jgi:hypothetical protein